MRKALICVFAAVMTGCATQRVVQDYQRDSVAVIVRDSLVLRDSVVLVEVPKGSAEALLPDSDTSRLETDIAESVAYVTMGELRHTLRNKSEVLLPITIHVPERIHTEKEVVLQAYKVTETVEVEKELNGVQRFMLGVGWVVCCGLLIYIISRVVRFFS